MSTATIRLLPDPRPEPLIITSLDRDGWDKHGEIADGDGLGSVALGFTDAQFEAMPDLDHPGVMAWERVIDEAIAEIGSQVRELLYQALERRLPWTWEPER